MRNPRSISGMIPAAGYARRISPLSCSKEIYPIRQPDGSSCAVASYLLKQLARVPASKSYLIIRPGKWDIPEYFGSGPEAEHDIAYLVTAPTRGVPFTVDKAYSFIKDDLVLLGFPDIILKPADAFSRLLKKQETTRADIVLGLFSTSDHQKTDMVAFNQDRITDIIVKPEQTDLVQTWMIAAWTPAFSYYLHQFAANPPSPQKSTEVHMGDVFRAAIYEGMSISHVTFPKGRYLDIGTPDNLKKASHINWLK